MNLRQIYSAFLTCLACFLCGEVRNWDLNSWLEAALPQHPALSEAEAVVLASKWRSEERVIWEDPEIRFGVEKSLAWRDEAFVSVRLRIPNAYEEKALSDRERSRLDMAIAEHTCWN